MAYEGFLTSIYAGKNIFRPTFFELIAQDQLADVFRPALRFFVEIVSERAPRGLLPFLEYWQAVYTFFLLFLEGYHLRVHGATFAEHFFGLRRQEPESERMLPLEALEKARRRLDAPPLNTKQRAASLIVAVVLPWVWAKGEERLRQLESFRPSTTTSPADVALHRFFPAMHAASAGLSFAYRFLYLLEQTGIWSPWLHLLGLRLVRHFPEPPGQLEEEEAGKSLATRARDLLVMCGKGSLWGGIYLLQFLQWWYQREQILQPLQARQAPPPPPEPYPYPESLGGPLSQGSRRQLVLLPEDRAICALCHRRRQNPAMSCSGYAFCYTCLVPHVQQHGHCPISGQQMLVEEIRRVRDDS
ncbi:PEX12 [Symbiodinium natans]|uniref:Peroxisome assembly protein 12 n=1 Tax=Symbiodinium natans TaxID=878477 RepID=A0A812QIK0_9DINO|nr:PEX12 [Symbiodinium natans]